jgi:hypothetical protein
MSFSRLYKLLWIIVHLLADLIETLWHFGFEFRENFRNFIKNFTKTRQFHESTDDKHLLESRIQELKKLPKHLAVILNANNTQDVDLRQLTNLVLWSLSSGVNFISFYDYKGNYRQLLSFRVKHMRTKVQTWDKLSCLKYFHDPGALKSHD